MKSLALFVGIIIVILGLVGITAPGLLMRLGQYSVTPIGLYAVAALRVAIGLVLLGASSASRMPTTLRVCGVVVLIAGITTPFLGVERAHAIMLWSASRPLVVRLAGLPAVAFGSLIMYAVINRRTSSHEASSLRHGR